MFIWQINLLNDLLLTENLISLILFHTLSALTKKPEPIQPNRKLMDHNECH